MLFLSKRLQPFAYYNILQYLCTHKRLEAIRNSGIRKKLDDIDLNLNWGEFAHNYFDWSASWFYNKLNGIDGNGGIGGFTEEELTIFKGGLCDLADRIRRAADKL